MSSRRALAAQRLIGSGATAVAMAVLSALVAVALTAIPVALDRLATAQLRQQISSLSPDARALTSTVVEHPELGPAPGDAGTSPDETAAVWGDFEAKLARVRDSAPYPLHSALGPAEFLISADPLLLNAVPGQPPARMYVSPSVDPTLTRHAQLVAGRWPDPQLSPPNRAGGHPIEIALSAETARREGWSLDQTRSAPLGSGVTGLSAEFRLTGIFDAAAGSADYWGRHPSVLVPKLLGRQQESLVYAAAVIHPAGWPVVVSFDDTTSMRVAIPFSADRATADQQPVLRGQLLTFLAAPHALSEPDTTPDGLAGIRFNSQSPEALTAAAASASTARSVLSVIAVAPVGAAFALLAAAAALLAARRRRVNQLLLWRGRSPMQVRLWAVAQGVVFAVFPGAIVVSVALWWSRNSPGPTALMLPAVGVLVPPAVLAVLVPTSRLPAAGSSQTARSAHRRAQRRRVLVELGVVLVAMASAGLLVRNGAVSGSADPLLLAAPILIGTVVLLVVRRTEPAAIRSLHRRLRRGRRLSAFLGSAHPGGGPAAGAPLIAIGLATATIVIAAVLLGTVDRGIDVSARATVGADLRVDFQALTASQLDAIAHTPGVRTTAPISVADAHILVNGISRPVTVYVAPTALLADIQQDVAGAPPIPAGGSDTVTVSDSLAGSTLTTIPSSSSSSSSSAHRLVVTGHTKIATGLGHSLDWLLVDSTSAAALVDTVPTADEVLIALEPTADPTAVSEALTAITAPGAVQGTAAVLGPLTRAPVVRGSRLFIVVALLSTALFTLLAFVVMVVAGTPTRRRTIGLLRTLGLHRRTGPTLISWELVPVAVVGFVSGAVAGVVDVLVLRSAIDLRPMTGNGPTPATAVDWQALWLSGLGLAFVVLASVIVAAAVARRTSPAVVLRFGEQ